MLLAKIVWAFLGLLLGTAVGFVILEFARYIIVDLLYGNYYEPFRRMPPAALLVGLSTAWYGFRNPIKLADKPSLTRDSKLFVAGFSVWSLVIFVLVWGLNVLGKYWNSDNWQRFWVIWLAPSILVLVSLALFRWAVRGEQKNS